MALLRCVGKKQGRDVLGVFVGFCKVFVVSVFVTPVSNASRCIHV